MSDTPQPQPPPRRYPPPAEIVEEPLPDWDEDPDEDVGEWPPPEKSRNIVDNPAEVALSRRTNGRADSLATSRMPCSGNSGWAVVHTHPQAERWCAANLERVGYRVYLPLYAALVRDPVLHTRTRTALRPLFERYLFVHHDSPQLWRPIREAPGVAAVLNDGLKLRYAPEAQILALQAGEDARHTLMAPGAVWAAGTPCTPVCGPFRGADAVVIAAGRKTARIALLMLGALREVSVRCDALAHRGAQ